MNPPGVFGLLLCLMCGVSAPACNTPGDALFPSFVPPGPYDELSDRAWERVVESRALWDVGDLRLARAGLRRIASEFPRNLAVGVLLQELELELLNFGIALPDLGLGEGAAVAEDGDAAALLRRHYREQSDRVPSPESLVLAARLEPDIPASRILLEQAIELDSECAWAHYGLAFSAFRNGDFRAATRSLERQRELDPRHLPGRRLRARMLASSQTAEVASAALNRWLKDAADNPFVRPRELAEAEFDLALLLVQVGESERVEKLCAGLLNGGWIDSTSVYLLLAASRVERDDIAAALNAARRASRSSPSSVLAHIQRALILEDWMAQPRRAFDAWARALEAASDSFEPAFETAERPAPALVRDAQLWLFAKTRLARLEAAGVRAASGGESGDR